MALGQLIYLSKANFKGPVEFELSMLQIGAARANRRVNVTGLLLYKSGHFLQLLEGPQAVVDQIYARILRDSRHTEVTQLLSRPVERRLFSQWQMGLLNLEKGTPMDRRQFEKLAQAAYQNESERVRQLYIHFRDQLTVPVYADASFEPVISYPAVPGMLSAASG